MKKVILACMIIAIVVLGYFLWLKNNLKCNPADAKSICSWQKISESKDVSICIDMSNEKDKKECENMVTLNSLRETDKMSECQKLEGEYRRSCIWNVMKKIQKISGCTGLITQDKQYCEDNYYFNMAIKDKNLATCGKIISIYEKTNCLEIIPRMPK